MREHHPAGLMAILATLAVGVIGGVRDIGGFLAGNIDRGLRIGMFMSSSGGMWERAKKYVEAGNFGG